MKIEQGRAEQIARPVHEVFETYDFKIREPETVYDADSGLLMETFLYYGENRHFFGSSIYCALEVKKDENSVPDDPTLELNVELLGKIKKPISLCSPGFFYQGDIPGGLSPEELVDYITVNDVTPALEFLFELRPGQPLFVHGYRDKGIGVVKRSDNQWVPYAYDRDSGTTYEDYSLIGEARSALWEHFDPDPAQIKKDILNCKPTDLGRWRRR
jgi:hypothetical protein